MDIRNASRPKIVTKIEEGNGLTSAKLSTINSGKASGIITEESTTLVAEENHHSNSTPTVDEITDDEVLNTHLEFLREKGIDKDTILSVLDMMLSGQTVLWQFDLLGKLPVVFRVRPQWVDKFLVEEIEKVKPSNMARFTDIVGTVNLAGSLEKYGDKTFSLKTKEDLQEVMLFLGSLPFIIQNKLVNELALFDRLVIVATSDWAVKNFT